MGFFLKNENEKAYVGGKKHWIDIIKNSGPGDLLIWRQPEEDFNTNSKVVVMPGEVAIFVNQGNVEQVFESGTYQLSTNNYPFISRLRNSLSGGISGFNCVVYFVRTAHSAEIRWGTDTPIQVRDKVWGIRTDLRARGSYKVQVENPVKFLEKLLGNNMSYETQEGLNRYFVSEFQSKIRTIISTGVNQLNTELIGIDSKLDEFSKTLEPIIDEALQEYGMRCKNFNIAAMDIDNEKYNAIDEAQVEAIRKQKFAMGDRAQMDTLGDNWGKLQAVNIMQDIAQNPNAGPVGTMGAGLGVGMMAGGMFGELAGQLMQPMKQQNAGGVSENQAASNVEDPMETLTKLKKMLDAGLIEQSEYDAKKAEILGRM